MVGRYSKDWDHRSPARYADGKWKCAVQRTLGCLTVPSRAVRASSKGCVSVTVATFSAALLVHFPSLAGYRYSPPGTRRALFLYLVTPSLCVCVPSSFRFSFFLFSFLFSVLFSFLFLFPCYHTQSFSFSVCKASILVSIFNYHFPYSDLFCVPQSSGPIRIWAGFEPRVVWVGPFTSATGGVAFSWAACQTRTSLMFICHSPGLLQAKTPLRWPCTTLLGFRLLIRRILVSFRYGICVCILLDLHEYAAEYR